MVKIIINITNGIYQNKLIGVKKKCKKEIQFIIGKNMQMEKGNDMSQTCLLTD